MNSPHCAKKEIGVLQTMTWSYEPSNQHAVHVHVLATREAFILSARQSSHHTADHIISNQDFSSPKLNMIYVMLWL